MDRDAKTKPLYTQVVPNECACSVFNLPPLCEHVPKLLRGCVPPTPELSDNDAIVEGRKVQPPVARGRST